MNETWLTRIKQKKRASGMTNEELSAAAGIPLGTLNKILSGVSDDPKLSTLTAFADVFDISLDYIAFGEDGGVRPSREEASHLYRLRSLDVHGKKLVRAVLDMEYERVSDAAPLNVPANSKILTSGRYSFSADRLTRRDPSSETLSIPLYDLPASAGRGALLDGSSSDFITITSGGEAKGADFALRVSGDSMEPRYIDGDIILVHEQTSVEEGELGIFVCSDGETQEGYFKRFGGDRLISLNPKYDDIPLDGFASVICRGRVIGRLPRRS